MIRAFAEKFSADGITCVEETVGVWLHRVKAQGVCLPRIWFPEPQRVERVLHKDFQIQAAQRAGLAVLPTVRIEPPGRPLPMIAEEFYPLCLRPSGGGVDPPFKVRLAKDRRELEEMVAGFRRFEKPLVAQPFRHLPNLVVHGSRTPDGKTLGLAAFLVPRKFQGVTLFLQPSRLQDRIRKGCLRFLEEMDVVGPFHFEFLWDGERGEAYFLELNNRFGGTTAKVLAVGYDEPGYAVAAFESQVMWLGDETRLDNVSVSNRQALLKYAAYALTGRLTPLDYPRESKVRSVWEALRGLFAYRDEVWAGDDLRGSVGLYGANLTGFWTQGRGQGAHRVSGPGSDSPEGP